MGRLKERGSLNVYGTKLSAFFLGSSAVERSAVNRSVVGSNPTRGDFHTSFTKVRFDF